jgi:glucoside 3-dehydrogenase (cytochrome c) hitch-hiker subunit
VRRRELISLIAALTGASVVGSDALWAAGGSDKNQANYSDADLRLFDELAETILPRTDTPGAKDAAVGKFIADYSAARYEPAHIAILKTGISEINARMQALHRVNFVQASPEQRRSLLVTIDAQANHYARVTDRKTRATTPHYFTLLKQLTLFGFFTSELGASHVVRYRPVPGKYKGCIPYKQGETFWAW